MTLPFVACMTLCLADSTHCFWLSPSRQHGPGISFFLGFLWKLGLHLYRFTHNTLRGFQQELEICHSLTTSQTLLSVQGRSLLDLTAVAFCVPATPASHGWHQGLPPAQVVSGSANHFRKHAFFFL
jgi:hypothetical protein